MLLSDLHSPTINGTTRIFIFIQCHNIILNSNILSVTKSDFNLALEQCASTKSKETVSFLSDAFALFLHLPKKKGASSSRDGWYPGLITANAYLQNKFDVEGAAGSSSSETVVMLSGLSKSRSCGSEGFAK